MIEEIVLQHLAGQLEVPVGMEVPENPADTYCVLEKTGSGRRNRLDTATFAVQSCGPTMLEAARLNQRVKAAMDRLAEHPKISRVQLNSDYNFTDTAQKRYRYQAVYDITFYEE